MTKTTFVLCAWLCAGTAAAAGLEGVEGEAPDCLFDNRCGAATAPPLVVDPGGLGATIEAAAPEQAGARRKVTAPEPPLPERAWVGAKKGAGEGAKLGFYGVLSPAIGLMSESFGRQMSSYYDGPRSDNGGGRAMWWGGLALAVVLYIPALVAGAAGAIVGGLVGAGAESVKPGATEGWDVERKLFD